jgi:NAD+ diphosphatase
LALDKLDPDEKFMKNFVKFNYCPRCARSSIEFYGKNGIRCTYCGFVYYHNTAAGVAAIIEADDKIVLLKRAHEPRIGYYDFPGGFVDYHESLDDAVVREVREELNIEIFDVRYFGSSFNEYQYKTVTYFAADAFFLCKPLDISMLRLSEENTAYSLIDPFTIDNESMAFATMVPMLEKYRAYASGVLNI